MNAWSEILRMLAEDKSLRELVIAPNAQPMDQHAKGRKVLGSRTFSADEVAETLVSASTMCPVGAPASWASRACFA